MCTARGKATHKGATNSILVVWMTGPQRDARCIPERDRFFLLSGGQANPLGPGCHHAFSVLAFPVASALNQRKGRAHTKEHHICAPPSFPATTNALACVFLPFEPPVCVRSSHFHAEVWLHNDPVYLCVRNSADLPRQNVRGHNTPTRAHARRGRA